MDNHFKVWEQYKKTLAKGQQPNRNSYMSFAKQNGAFFPAVAKALAPVLYFDFTGLSSKEYILDSITVRTLAYDEYSGGGFFDQQAGYEIVLSPKPGTKTVSVARRLRFTGSGRAQLKIWSGNFDNTSGIAPMGCYMIEIQFNFTSDNRKLSVSTGPFKIDV